MIFSIRGTNGSGKTTVMRSILSAATINRPLFGALGHKEPEAHELTLPGINDFLYALGPYVSGRGCEGIDRISTIVSSSQKNTFLIGQDNSLENMIVRYAKKGHVIFEGMLVSHTYGAIGKLMEQWGRGSVFVFMDTPLEECLKRVEQRRGRLRDARLVRNMGDKYTSMLRVQQRVQQEGLMTAIVASIEDAPAHVLKLLKRPQWSK